MVDPLAENSLLLSPYAYVANNPARNIDPDGQDYLDGIQGQYTRKDGSVESYDAAGRTQTLTRFESSDGSDQGGEANKKQEAPISGAYPNGTLRSGPEQNAVIKATVPKKFGWWFTPEEQAAQTGVDIGSAVESGFSLMKVGKWFKSLFEFGQAIKGEAKFTIQFGKTENQIYHAFRHTDALGLERTIVETAIKKHFPSIASKITEGKPLNSIIEIAGQRIQYSAFKLSDGTINIGRIHGVK